MSWSLGVRHELLLRVLRGQALILAPDFATDHRIQTRDALFSDGVFRAYHVVIASVAAGLAGLLGHHQIQQVAVADEDGFVQCDFALKNLLPGYLIVVLRYRVNFGGRIE